MDICLQLFVLKLSILSTLGDISHLFLPEYTFFQPPQQSLPSQFLYAPPQAPPQPSLQPPVSSTTEFFFPEIIINRQAKDPQHGNFIPLNHYLPPPVDQKPPVQQDDSRPTNPVYLPPKRDEHPRPVVVLEEPVDEGYEYERPLSTSKPSFEDPSSSALLPPAADAPFNDTPQPTEDDPSKGYQYHQPGPTYLPPSDGNTQLRLHVKEMRCLDQQGGYLRAVLKVDSFLAAIPTVDNDANDSKCELKLSKSYLVVNVAAEDFSKCGVQRCGKELCLRLRFPTIRGMRTNQDSILTLHCTTQSRVAVKTHALKMAVSNDLQARSSGVYAHGGSQNAFHTHVELLRKSPNGYTKHLEPNGAVQLGEDLLLRAHVIAGDGWKYTKLTDVNLQRISPSGELSSSANLISSRGCVNPSMRGVCSQEPIFEPPLGHRLPFKAVMFRGMRSGDEMILSMKITGCLEHQDCYIGPQDCNDVNPRRQRREVKGNSTEVSEVSRISFRVVMPSEKDKLQSGHEIEAKNDRTEWKPENELGNWITAGVLCFVGLLCILGLYICFKVRD